MAWQPTADDKRSRSNPGPCSFRPGRGSPAIAPWLHWEVDRPAFPLPPVTGIHFPIDRGYADRMSATDPIPRSPPIFDEPPTSACSQEQTIKPCRNWKDYSQEYNGAFWTALKLQLVLAIVTTLVLDMGQTHRAFWVAFLGQWVVAWIILIRRPMHPTRTDLAVVRYGIIPLLLIVAGFGPALLRLRGVQE